MKSKAKEKYRLQDGTMVPGVTTILSVLAKPALVPWANKLGLQGIDVRKYVDDKADIGTLAHAMILAHLEGKKPDTSDYSQKQIDQAENSFLSYLEWEKGKEIKPVLLEKPLVSEVHKYGGTPDFVGYIDGIPAIMDFKTGAGIYKPEMPMQLAAYSRLVREATEIEPESYLILRIGRDESEGFETCNIGNIDTYWAMFEKCLEFYKLNRSLNLRR